MSCVFFVFSLWYNTNYFLPIVIFIMMRENLTTCFMAWFKALFLEIAALLSLKWLRPFSDHYFSAKIESRLPSLNVWFNPIKHSIDFHLTLLTDRMSIILPSILFKNKILKDPFQLYNSICVKFEVDLVYLSTTSAVYNQ